MGFRYSIAIIDKARFGGRLLVSLVCCFSTFLTRAQTPAQIISELKLVNNNVANTPCSTGRGMLISNKAMNIFLSNKVSSYLSGNEDLSLYKNYVTLNASEGSITINHNFHQPVDSDDWVKSFVIIGARANIANAYAARFSNKYFDNRLGFVLQKTWMGKPITFYDKCSSQKMAMDAQRSAILHGLETTLNRKAVDFERALDSIKQAEIPGQSPNAAKTRLRQGFYAALRSEYLQKFSEAQSDLLIKTNNYNLVTDNWTSLGIYIPIILQKFEVSTALNTDVARRYNYPLEFSVSHTRLWESIKVGRIFFTLSTRAFLNNSIQSGALYNADISGPEIANGANTLSLNQGNRFIGDYKNYVTPVVAGKLVYIPPDSHVGVSFRVEKNFGTYHALNSILGIPIVLIDKNGVPAINFEAQILFTDMNNSIKSSQLPFNKNAIGLTVGIPFSKIVY
ncbi:MAG: hypothetical protein JWP37_420 [Mucilaginibacter sp.]|nr:hypothetical protein [Mucilaginibacter sp.]